jgi:hypothetical protein
MKTRIVMLAIAWLALLGCGGRPVPVAPSADVTSYYVGTHDMIGMDGGHFFHAAPILVVRTLSPRRGLIVETTYGPAEQLVVTTTLTQTEYPQVFTVADAEGSFSGTRTYTGDPWNPIGWRYELTGVRGERVTGSALVRDDHFSSAEVYRDAGGTMRARIFELVRRVSKEEFLARRKRITGS